MNTFEVYVHGTPRGLKIWGSEKNHDYINRFYNHDAVAKDKAVLQIDVCAGYSFYTYIRRQNVFDVEGRPEAFFALTVSFKNAYCTNVYKLYQLFDTVYNKICVGAILNQSKNGEGYIVADFKDARSGSKVTVDVFNAAFSQKVAELIEPALAPITFGDTFNSTKKTFSLKEVDSPLFIEYCKKYSIEVLPNLDPSAIAYDNAVTELKQIKVQKAALSTTNNQLQSEVDSLKKENNSLVLQLNESTASAEKKYKEKMNQLQSDLSNAVKDRDSLKQKIAEATDSIELIEKPFENLLRLMAGRFPQNGKSRREDSMENAQEISKKSKKPTWYRWFNSVLLILVLIVCCAVLVIVKNGKTDQSYQDDVTETESIVPEYTDNVEPSQPKEVQSVNVNTESTDISWSEYKINVYGSSDGKLVHNSVKYSVDICNKDGDKANVPAGKWVIDLNDDHPINENGSNSFIVPANMPSGTNILVKYVVNDKTVVSKTVTVN